MMQAYVGVGTLVVAEARTVFRGRGCAPVPPLWIPELLTRTHRLARSTSVRCTATAATAGQTARGEHREAAPPGA